jgi:sialate O-acetylesterase
MPDSAWSALRRAEDRRLNDVRAAMRARLGALPESDIGLSNGTALWAAPGLADSSWSEMPVPAYWEQHGYPDLDGVAWYRRTIDLTEQERRGGATLDIAAIDDDDITWMNGLEVGRTTGYNVRRHYVVPATALRVGRNVLAVRVTDGGGGGGVNGDVSLTLSDGSTRSLGGVWRFRVGAVALRPDGQHINKIPAVTFNGMVHPLRHYPLKGVIWYQGESNANDARQAAAYRAQFYALIRSWRRELTPSGPLPFLWVQLPNFGTPDSVPPTSPAWAIQRESMAAALALPNTGQAVTIDVGEEKDIHPRNKQDVGVRLAKVALAVAYGRPVRASGPTYRASRVRGSRMIVSFDHAESGLRSRAPDSSSVGAFAIAGADGRFRWANARIVGSRVEVWNDSIASPVAVRYAWSNAPQGPLLYNRYGLPAAPFRTDRW